MPRAAIQPREETGGSPRSIISKIMSGITPGREGREQPAEVESGPPPELGASNPYPTTSHSTSEHWEVIAAGVSHSDSPPVLPPSCSIPHSIPHYLPLHYPYTVSTHTARHRTTLSPLSTAFIPSTASAASGEQT